MSLEKQKILQSEVFSYMLNMALAEPCTSPWSFPCWLVQKPDTIFRPCADSHKVNVVTKPDSHPLPTMEDCVDQVGSAQYVSR